VGAAPSSRAPAVSPASRPTPVSAAPPASASGPDAVETDGSFLVHRVSELLFSVTRAYLFQVVPDDNSCLFSSVALIFEQDMKKAQKMRESMSPSIVLVWMHSSATQLLQMAYEKMPRPTTRPY
jgi:ubiquitin thioesterase OTU1